MDQKIVVSEAARKRLRLGKEMGENVLVWGEALLDTRGVLEHMEEETHGLSPAVLTKAAALDPQCQVAWWELAAQKLVKGSLVVGAEAGTVRALMSDPCAPLKRSLTNADATEDKETYPLEPLGIQRVVLTDHKVARTVGGRRTSGQRRPDNSTAPPTATGDRLTFSPTIGTAVRPAHKLCSEPSPFQDDVTVPGVHGERGLAMERRKAATTGVIKRTLVQQITLPAESSTRVPTEENWSNVYGNAHQKVNALAKPVATDMGLVQASMDYDLGREDGAKAAAKAALRPQGETPGKTAIERLSVDELWEQPLLVGKELGKVGVPFEGCAAELLNLTARGASMVVQPSFVYQQGTIIATTRAVITLPTQELRAEEAQLRAGAADIGRSLRLPGIAGWFQAWLWFAAANGEGKAPKISRRFPRILNSDSDRGLRDALWRTEEGQRRWLRVAHGNSDVWLRLLVLHGLCVYGWRRPQRLEVQPPDVWPLGPLSREVLQIVTTEWNEMVRLGVAYWLDPPLVPGLWDRLCREGKASVRRHCVRLHKAEAATQGEKAQYGRRYQNCAAIPKRGDNPDDPTNRMLRIICACIGRWGNDDDLWVHQVFSHGGFRECVKIVSPGCYLSDSDLTKFFWQINVSELTRQAQVFWIGGRRAVLTGAAMGLHLTPYVAQRILLTILAEVRRRAPYGRITGCIDDVYMAADTIYDSMGLTAGFTQVCGHLGAQISVKKTHLQGRFIIKMLQNVVNARSMRCYTPQPIVRATKKLCDDFIFAQMHQRPYALRTLASLVGTVQSTVDTAWMVTMSMQGIRNLLARSIQAAWDQERSRPDWDAAIIIAKSEWFAKSDAVRLREMSSWSGRSLLPVMPDHLLASDAGPRAKGAVWLTGPVPAIRVSPHEDEASVVSLRQLFLQYEQAFSQNRKETDGIGAAAVTFCRAQRWSNKTVGIFTDNRTAWRYFMKGGPVLSLTAAAVRFQQLLWDEAHVKLVVYWAAGLDLWIADEWSRTHESTPQWRLAPAALQAIEKKMGVTHTVDVCADERRRVCRKYIGPCPQFTLHRDMLAVNVLNTDMGRLMQGERAWCMPPGRLTVKIVKHFTRHEIQEYTLVTKGSPKELVCLMTLIEMSVELPIIIPFSAGLWQLAWSPQERPQIRRNQILVVWRLSACRLQRHEFQKRHGRSFWDRTQTDLVEQSMMLGSTSSLITTASVKSMQKVAQAVSSLRQLIRSRVAFSVQRESVE